MSTRAYKAPEDHPFWMSNEEPLPPHFLQHPHTSIEQWCQVISRAAGRTFVLNGGESVKPHVDPYHD
jgi:hypothetical protein